MRERSARTGYTPEALAKTIEPPSGDQDGEYAPKVPGTLCTPDPVGLTVYRKPRVKAILDPSGDQAGSPSCVLWVSGAHCDFSAATHTAIRPESPRGWTRQAT